MRKIFIIAAATAAVLALAGCSSLGGAADDEALEIWIRKPPGSASAATGQRLVDAFTEKTGIPARLTPIQEDFETKLQQRTIQRTLPDIIINDTAQLGTMNSQGILREITKDEIGGSRHVPERAWDGATGTDGRIYGVPHTAHAFGLYVRGDRLAEAGLDEPETMDEFAEVVSTLGEKGEDAAPFAVPGSTKRGYLSWNFASFLWSSGGDYLTETGPGTWRSAIGSDESEAAVQWLQDLACEGGIQSGAPSMDTTATEELFEGGGADMFLSLPHKLAGFSESVGPDNLDVIAPPSGAAGRTVLAEGNNTYLMQGSDHPEEQIAFAEFSITKKAQILAMDGDRDGNIVRIPVNDQIVMSDVRDDQRWNTFQEIYDEYGRYVPQVPNWTPFLQMSADAFNGLIADCDADVGTTLDTLDGRFTDELAEQEVLGS